MKPTPWCVYIIECKNNALYTGITNNIQQRYTAHCEGCGSKYTRAFGVKKLVYTERTEDKSSALRKEAMIKRLTREQKVELIKRKNKL
ncbi:MAG: GIY-YIG nuclease family protein [Elusimicrobiota bacterium]